MRMRTAVVLVIVFALLLVASCSSPKGPTVNRLMVEDGWIYFTLNEENALYKMKTDGTESSLLGENIALITIADNWIYYGEFTGNGDLGEEIYRMTLEGTENKKIVEGRYVDLDGGHIYFTKKMVFIKQIWTERKK